MHFGVIGPSHVHIVAMTQAVLDADGRTRVGRGAQEGEVLVSSLRREPTESAGDIAFGEGRVVKLKGPSGRLRPLQVE
jgi:hypothetical protein